jgi:hypothetical protein
VNAQLWLVSNSLPACWLMNVGCFSAKAGARQSSSPCCFCGLLVLRAHTVLLSLGSRGIAVASVVHEMQHVLTPAEHAPLLRRL